MEADSMENAHVIESLPSYVLGDLQGDELLRVARHLPGCAECRAALLAYWHAVDELPQALPLHAPPADLRARVVTHVGAASTRAASSATQRATHTAHEQTPRPPSLPARPAMQERPRSPASRSGIPNKAFWRSTALAGLALLAVLLIIAASTFFLRPSTPAAPVRMVTLAGDQTSPNTVGYLIVFPGDTNGSLTVDHAPVPPPGYQYQAWLILDGKRVSGGVFSVNTDGYGVLQITSDRPLDQYDSLGVTLEPAGGSPGPTGTRILGGDL